jgi:hypothetical protein
VPWLHALTCAGSFKVGNVVVSLTSAQQAIGTWFFSLARFGFTYLIGLLNVTLIYVTPLHKTNKTR